MMGVMTKDGTQQTPHLEDGQGQQGSAVLRALPQMSTASFWGATCALACVLLSAYLMNYAVFPLFDSVLTEARSISQLMHALFLLLIGAAAMFSPKLLARIRLRVASCVLLAVGVVLLPCAIATQNAALLLIGSIAFAMGRAVVLLAAALALTRIGSRDGVVTAVSIAFVASTALQALFWLAPAYVGAVAFLVLPCAAYAIVFSEVRPLTDLALASEAPADAIVTRPKSFLPPLSRMFVCLFLFRIAFGFSLRFGEVEGVPVGVFFGIVPIGAAALLLVLWQRFSADLLTGASSLFVVAGFFLVGAAAPASLPASNMCLSAGNSLFDMVSWIVIASVGARNPSGALAVAAWGTGVGSLGSVVGAELGVLSNQLVEGNPAGLLAVSGVLLVLFAGYVIIGLKSFSFKAVIDGVTPAQPDEGAQQAETEPMRFSRCCDEIAERFHFTPREREVFELLARGRNREYIQEKLVVSRNTVKVHVRHIYEKAGIHSHQELIDLVEGDLAAKGSDH